MAILGARRVVMQGDSNLPGRVDGWIERSWRRCLDMVLDPRRPLVFDPVSKAQMRHIQDTNHHLLATAAPLLEQLGRAIANTRFLP